MVCSPSMQNVMFLSLNMLNEQFFTSQPNYRYFEHFGRTSKSATYAGLLSFMIRKVIAHILK